MVLAGCGKDKVEEYVAKAESGELSSADLEYIKELASEEKQRDIS